MNIEQIEEGLPWGFHDADLLTVKIDYEHARAEFDLVLPLDERQTTFRPGRLTLVSLFYLAIEPPDARYPFAPPGLFSIDSGPGEPSTSKTSLPPVSEDAFRHWFFVSAWNSFIHVAAKDATFEWTGESFSNVKEESKK